MLKNLFRKGLVIFLIGLCLASLLVGNAFGRSYVGGIMYTREGKKIDVLRFLAPLNKDDVVIGRAGDEIIKVRVAEIGEINFLTANVNYIYQHSKLIKQTGILTLLLRDGRSLMLSDAYFDKGTLVYIVLNSERRKVERKIRLRDILQIRFEQTSGKVRTCPIDRAVFPDDYLFCPYHGVPLTWGNP